MEIKLLIGSNISAHLIYSTDTCPRNIQVRKARLTNGLERRGKLEGNKFLQ